MRKIDRDTAKKIGQALYGFVSCKSCFAKEYCQTEETRSFTCPETIENWLCGNLNPELKPCPFCGNTNVVFVVDSEYESPKIIEYNIAKDAYIAVLCNASQGGCGAMGGYGSGFEEAVKKWNNRAKKLRKDK